ncbi:hypothetical protein FQN51_002799 [Onygenales sp. PD_10]|nr:hypothetical protein FQN51_002799 [Onygenales sp. PD_10]
MLRSLLGKPSTSSSSTTSSSSSKSRRRRDRDRDRDPDDTRSTASTSSHRRRRGDIDPRASSSSTSLVPTSTTSATARRSARGDDRGIDDLLPAVSARYEHENESVARSGVESYVTADERGRGLDGDFDGDEMGLGLARSRSGDVADIDVDVREDDERSVARSERRRRERGHDGHRERERSGDREREERRRLRRERERDGEKSRRRAPSREVIVNNPEFSTSRADPGGGDEGFMAEINQPGFSQFPMQYTNTFPGAVPGQPPPVDPHQVPTSQPYHPPPGQLPGGPPGVVAPPAPAVGEAAEYYNDQGQSVATQPGVRPNPPSLIIGAEPHLMAASATPNPPAEPSSMGQSGAAADFYGGPPVSSAEPHGNPPIQPSPVLSDRPPKPSKPGQPSVAAAAAAGVATYGIGSAVLNGSNGHHTPSSSFTPHHAPHLSDPSYHPALDGGRPPKPNKHHSMPVAGAAALGAVAGYAVAGHHSTPQRPSTFGGGGYQPGSLAYHQRHHGPLRRFINFWKDPEAVAQFEEYSEYIGVCKYCFEPGSTPLEAPRKHNPKRRRYSDEHGGSAIRVDKAGRYTPSDHESRRKKSNKKSWLAAGLAGYVGKSLLDRKEFDDSYSIRSGRPASSVTSTSTSSLGKKSRTSRGTAIYSNRSRSPLGISSDYGRDGKGHASGSHSPGRHRGDADDKSSYRRRRSRSRSRSVSRDRSHSGLKTAAVAAGALGAASVISSKSRRRRSRSRSPKKSRSRYSSSNGSTVDISRSYSKPGISGFTSFFTSPSEKKTKVHTKKMTRKTKKKRKGFFSFSSSSSGSSSSSITSSSDDADLAFGTGFIKSPKGKKASRKRDDRDVDAALLGLGATAAGIAASVNGRRGRDGISIRDNRSPHSIYRNETKSTASGPVAADGWEYVSDEGSASSSVDSALAYGGSASIHSKDSQDSGTSKWGWRWGSSKKKKRSSEQQYANRPEARDYVQQPGYPLPSQHAPPSSVGSLPSMHNVYPIPTGDPSQFDATNQGSYASQTQPYIQPQPPLVARQVPTQIEHPQPIVPVSQALYTTQAELAQSYVAPTAAPVFSRSSGEYDDRHSRTSQDQYGIQPLIEKTRKDKYEDDRYSSKSRDEYGIQPLVEKVRKDKKYEEETRSRTSRKESGPRRRASSPIISTTHDGSSRPKEHRRSTTSQVQFDLTEEQEDKERRQMRYEEDRETRRREREFRAVADRERRERERDDRREREREYTDRPIDPIDKESSSRRSDVSTGSSKVTPIAASVLGGAAIASVVSEIEARREQKRAEERREQRRKQRRGEYVDEDRHDDYSVDYRDKDVGETKKIFDIKDIPTTKIRLARMAADRVKSSPVYENYADYFTPEELRHSGDDHSIRSGVSDVGSSGPPSPNIILIEPQSVRLEREMAAMLAEQRMAEGIPRLNLIKPTPPPSVAPSVIGDDDAARRRTPSPRNTDPIIDHDEPQPRKVDVADIISQHVEDKNSPDPEPVLVQPNHEDRSISPIPSVTEEPRSRQSYVSDVEDEQTEDIPAPQHIPGEFGNDIEFAATLAAGATLAGFNSAVVTDNPTYHRRDSPPGSEAEGAFTSPVAEAIVERRASPPTYGYVGDKELPLTYDEAGAKLSRVASKEERADIEKSIPLDEDVGLHSRPAAEESEERPAKLSKKERRKMSKGAKRKSQDQSVSYDDPEMPTTGIETSDFASTLVSGQITEEPETIKSPITEVGGFSKKSAKRGDEFFDAEEGPSSPSDDINGNGKGSGTTTIERFLEGAEFPHRPDDERSLERHQPISPSPHDELDSGQAEKTKEQDSAEDHRPMPGDWDEPKQSKKSKRKAKKAAKNMTDDDFVEPDAPLSAEKPQPEPEPEFEPSKKSKRKSKRNGKRFEPDDDDEPAAQTVDRDVNVNVDIGENGDDRDDTASLSRSNTLANDDDDVESVESLKSRSKRRSKRDSEIFDEQSPKSKRDSRVFDDAASVVSSPAKLDDSKEKKKGKDKDSGKRSSSGGGGFFGLFGASKSQESLSDKHKSRDVRSEAGVDELEDGEKRRRKKRSSRSRRDRDEDDDNDDARSVVSLESPGADRDRGKGGGEGEGEGEGEWDGFEHRKKRKDRRHRYEEIVDSVRAGDGQSNAGRSTTSNGHDSGDGDETETQENQSFLGARPEMPLTRDGASGLFDSALLPQQDKQRMRSRSVSPAPGRRLFELQPQSRSRPASPSSLEGGRLPSSSLALHEDPHSASSQVLASSPTRVPLHFRRPKSSSGVVTKSPTVADVAESPSQGKGGSSKRPRSTEFKTSLGEFRPLWLVERHSAVKLDRAPDEPYPSLPSSKTTSRTSSVEDLKASALPEGFAYEPPAHQAESLSERRKRPLSLQLGGEDDLYDADILDSQQATPTAASFHAAAEKKEKPKYEFHSPSELLLDPLGLPPSPSWRPLPSPEGSMVGAREIEAADRGLDLENLPPLPRSLTASPEPEVPLPPLPNSRPSTSHTEGGSRLAEGLLAGAAVGLAASVAASVFEQKHAEDKALDEDLKFEVPREQTDDDKEITLSTTEPTREVGSSVISEVVEKNQPVDISKSTHARNDSEPSVSYFSAEEGDFRMPGSFTPEELAVGEGQASKLHQEITPSAPAADVPATASVVFDEGSEKLVPEPTEPVEIAPPEPSKIEADDFQPASSKKAKKGKKNNKKKGQHADAPEDIQATLSDDKIQGGEAQPTSRSVDDDIIPPASEKMLEEKEEPQPIEPAQEDAPFVETLLPAAVTEPPFPEESSSQGRAEAVDAEFEFPVTKKKGKKGKGKQKQRTDLQHVNEPAKDDLPPQPKEPNLEAKQEDSALQTDENKQDIPPPSELVEIDPACVALPDDKDEISELLREDVQEPPVTTDEPQSAKVLPEIQGDSTSVPPESSDSSSHKGPIDAEDPASHPPADDADDTWDQPSKKKGKKGKKGRKSMTMDEPTAKSLEAPEPAEPYPSDDLKLETSTLNTAIQEREPEPEAEAPVPENVHTASIPLDKEANAPEEQAANDIPPHPIGGSDAPQIDTSAKRSKMQSRKDKKKRKSLSVPGEELEQLEPSGPLQDLSAAEKASEDQPEPESSIQEREIMQGDTLVASPDDDASKGSQLEEDIQHPSATLESQELVQKDSVPASVEEDVAARDIVPEPEDLPTAPSSESDIAGSAPSTDEPVPQVAEPEEHPSEAEPFDLPKTKKGKKGKKKRQSVTWEDDIPPTGSSEQKPAASEMDTANEPSAEAEPTPPALAEGGEVEEFQSAKSKRKAKKDKKKKQSLDWTVDEPSAPVSEEPREHAEPAVEMPSEPSKTMGTPAAQPEATTEESRELPSSSEQPPEEPEPAVHESSSHPPEEEQPRATAAEPVEVKLSAKEKRKAKKDKKNRKSLDWAAEESSAPPVEESVEQVVEPVVEQSSMMAEQSAGQDQPIVEEPSEPPASTEEQAPKQLEAAVEEPPVTMEPPVQEDELAMEEFSKAFVEPEPELQAPAEPSLPLPDAHETHVAPTEEVAEFQLSAKEKRKAKKDKKKRQSLDWTLDEPSMSAAGQSTEQAEVVTEEPSAPLVTADPELSTEPSSHQVDGGELAPSAEPPEPQLTGKAKRKAKKDKKKQQSLDWTTAEEPSAPVAEQSVEQHVQSPAEAPSEPLETKEPEPARESSLVPPEEEPPAPTDPEPQLTGKAKRKAKKDKKKQQVLEGTQNEPSAPEEQPLEHIEGPVEEFSKSLDMPALEQSEIPTEDPSASLVSTEPEPLTKSSLPPPVEEMPTPVEEPFEPQLTGKAKRKAKKDKKKKQALDWTVDEPSGEQSTDQVQPAIGEPPIFSETTAQPTESVEHPLKETLESPKEPEPEPPIEASLLKLQPPAEEDKPAADTMEPTIEEDSGMPAMPGSWADDDPVLTDSPETGTGSAPPEAPPANDDGNEFPISTTKKKNKKNKKKSRLADWTDEIESPQVEQKAEEEPSSKSTIPESVEQPLPSPAEVPEDVPSLPVSEPVQERVESILVPDISETTIPKDPTTSSFEAPTISESHPALAEEPAPQATQDDIASESLPEHLSADSEGRPPTGDDIISDTTTSHPALVTGQEHIPSTDLARPVSPQLAPLPQDVFISQKDDATRTLDVTVEQERSIDVLSKSDLPPAETPQPAQEEAANEEPQTAHRGQPMEIHVLDQASEVPLSSETPTTNLGPESHAPAEPELDEWNVPSTKKGKKKKNKKGLGITDQPAPAVDEPTVPPAPEPATVEETTEPKEKAVDEETPSWYLPTTTKKGKKKNRKSRGLEDDSLPIGDAQPTDLPDAPEAVAAPEPQEPQKEESDPWNLPSSKKGKKKNKKGRVFEDEPIIPDNKPTSDDSIEVGDASNTAVATETPVEPQEDDGWGLPTTKKGRKKNKNAQAFQNDTAPSDEPSPPLATEDPASQMDLEPQTEQVLEEWDTPASTKKGKKKNRKGRDIPDEDSVAVENTPAFEPTEPVVPELPTRSLSKKEKKAKKKGKKALWDPEDDGEATNDSQQPAVTPEVEPTIPSEARSSENEPALAAQITEAERAAEDVLDKNTKSLPVFEEPTEPFHTERDNVDEAKQIQLDIGNIPASEVPAKPELIVQDSKDAEVGVGEKDDVWEETGKKKSKKDKKNKKGMKVEVGVEKAEEEREAKPTQEVVAEETPAITRSLSKKDRKKKKRLQQFYDEEAIEQPEQPPQEPLQTETPLVEEAESKKVGLEEELAEEPKVDDDYWPTIDWNKGETGRELQSGSMTTKVKDPDTSSLDLILSGDEPKSLGETVVQQPPDASGLAGDSIGDFDEDASPVGEISEHQAMAYAAMAALNQETPKKVRHVARRRTESEHSDELPEISLDDTAEGFLASIDRVQPQQDQDAYGSPSLPAVTDLPSTAQPRALDLAAAPADTAQATRSVVETPEVDDFWGVSGSKGKKGKKGKGKKKADETIAPPEPSIEPTVESKPEALQAAKDDDDDFWRDSGKKGKKAKGRKRGSNDTKDGPLGESRQSALEAEEKHALGGSSGSKDIQGSDPPGSSGLVATVFPFLERVAARRPSQEAKDQPLLETSERSMSIDAPTFPQSFKLAADHETMSRFEEPVKGRSSLDAIPQSTDRSMDVSDMNSERELPVIKDTPRREPPLADAEAEESVSARFRSSPSTRVDVEHSSPAPHTPTMHGRPKDFLSGTPTPLPAGEPTEHPRSIFGGPYGLGGDQGAIASPPRTPLATIKEHVPEESARHARHRDLADVGSPERGIKSARHTGSPQLTIGPEHMLPQPRSPRPSKPARARDSVSGAVSAQPATLDMPKKRRGERAPADARRTASSPYADSPTPAERKEAKGQPRARSIGSTESLSAESGATLRRGHSGDLRAARRLAEAGEARDDDVAGVPSSSNYDPLTDKGKRAVRGGMADVYEGWGDVPGSSPRSPTRPPSVRRRRSLQHLHDLESRVDQLVSENRLLSSAKATAEQQLESQSLAHRQTERALQTRDQDIANKDLEIQQLKNSLDWFQKEIARLTEANESLTATSAALQASHELEASQHAAAKQSLRELQDQHSQLSAGLEGIVQNEINNVLAEKNAELQHLRAELADAREKVKALQIQIMESMGDNVLVFRDEDYFDGQCQKLCQHVQQWVLRFSKFSDMRLCRLTSAIRDEKVALRFENAILDGSDVDTYLSDRVRRRDVFMSVVMTMVWEYIFTRYLFGMDREQRQKLKTLEKQLSDVGPPSAVQQWRATTLSLLAKRPAFEEQRANDTEAVVQEIYHTLSKLLPPPRELEHTILESLRNVMRAAVGLSIEMRTQRAEYIMLPPLQPEYTADGELARKVHFKAALMNERSGETTSNEQLEEQQAVVRVVLFPLVVKKCSDEGDGDEEIVVCPAQVLVARPGKDKKVVRVLSGDRMSIDQATQSMQSFPSINMEGSNVI